MYDKKRKGRRGHAVKNENENNLSTREKYTKNNKYNKKKIEIKMTTDTETKIKTTRKWFSPDIQRQKRNRHKRKRNCQIKRGEIKENGVYKSLKLKGMREENGDIPTGGFEGETQRKRLCEMYA